MYSYHLFTGNGTNCTADRGDGVICYLARDSHTLEEAKRRRGGKCFQCGKILTYKDEDHTFCNSCWDQLIPLSIINEYEIETDEDTINDPYVIAQFWSKQDGI